MAEKEQTLDALLERSASTDIPLLIKAREDAKRRVKDDPTAANLAALKSANQLLRDALGNQQGNRTFADVKSVLAYLQNNGRKVSQAQLYKDLKRGYLRRQPDKSFRQRDVDAYATTLSVVSMPEREADENSDLAKQKLREDIAKTREQRRSIVFAREKEAGKYILREDVSLELASRAAALGLGLRSVFRLNVADYIRMVGGDVGMAEELAAEFEKNLDMALNEYSKPMDFKVEYVPATEGANVGQADEDESTRDQ